MTEGATYYDIGDCCTLGQSLTVLSTVCCRSAGSKHSLTESTGLKHSR